MNFLMSGLAGKMSAPLSVFFVIVIVGVSLLQVGGNTVADSAVTELSTEECVSDAFHPSDVPTGWDVSMTNPQSRGWLQTGVIPSGVEMAQQEVSLVMQQHGYCCRHVVDETEGHDHVLLQYEGNGQKLIWSLWAQDKGKTGFSWGVSK